MMDKRIPGWIEIVFAILILFFSVTSTLAQTTALTYQGTLSESGNPANSNYDFEFKLIDALNGGEKEPGVRLEILTFVSTMPGG